MPRSRAAQMQKEIKCYINISKSIASSMMRMSKVGFVMCGSGCSLKDNVCDWSIILDISKSMNTYIMITYTHNGHEVRETSIDVVLDSHAFYLKELSIRDAERYSKLFAGMGKNLKTLTKIMKETCVTLDKAW